MPSNLRRHNEPGHTHFWTISCYHRLGFLFQDKMKQVAVDGLKVVQADFNICLVGYVIMPDHVHVLIYPHAHGCDTPINISKLLNRFKQHTGYYGKACLRDYWHQHDRLWSEPLNQWARGTLDRQDLWNPRGYDFNIDRQHTLLEKLEYCHKNPITRGLVDAPEDWPWSSYRFYEMDDRSALTMDWNGQWPIIW